MDALVEHTSLQDKMQLIRVEDLVAAKKKLPEWLKNAEMPVLVDRVHLWAACGDDALEYLYKHRVAH